MGGVGADCFLQDSKGNRVTLPIQFYAFSGLLNFFTSLILGVFIFLVSSGTTLRIVFAFLCFAVSFWSFFFFLWLSTHSASLAEFYLRTCMYTVCFMPVLFRHFVAELTKKSLPKKYLYFHYGISVVFSLSIYSRLFAHSPESFLIFPVWLHPGILLSLFIIYFGATVVYSLLLLWKSICHNQGAYKTRVLYVFVAAWFAFIPGALVFCGWYRIPVPPFLTGCISLYVLIISYAIIRFRLMDVRLAITSVGLFLAVYTVALGIPFYLHGRGHYTISLWLAILLASFAPFIYSRLRKQAEDKIFEEQRVYQDILLKASQGLTRLKKVDEISRFVVNVFLKAIRIKSAAFYLYDGQKYVRKDTVGDIGPYVDGLAGDAPVVAYLRATSAVLVDEISHGGQNGEGDVREVKGFFADHPAHVAVPVMRDSRVIGLIFLGAKENNSLYSDRDLAVLNVIADQAGLAMENAAHLETSKKDFIEQMHDRRLKDIGLLGSTISHQMCNRLQKITLGLEYAQTILNDKALEKDSREELVAKVRECFGDFEVMKRDALSAAEISDALKNFSRSGSAPSAVTLKRLVKMAKDLVDAKHRDFDYELAEDYDDKLTLWVNVSSIQDVLFNAFDNSLDSIKIKMNSVNRPIGFLPRILVKAKAAGESALVEVVDNGIGFRPENLEKVFIPFFTTKGTAEGTGLGLHAMRELVRRNGGDITISSEFMQWALVAISLPLAGSKRVLAPEEGTRA